MNGNVEKKFMVGRETLNTTIFLGGLSGNDHIRDEFIMESTSIYFFIHCNFAGQMFFECVFSIMTTPYRYEITTKKQTKGLMSFGYVFAAVTKKLNKLTNKNKMEIVALWRKSIVNHLHWVAASTPDGDADTMVAKWLSLLNHVINRHERHDDLLLRLNHHIKQQLHGHLFPACVHRPIQEDDRNKLWFTPGTVSCFFLEEV